MKGFIGLFVVSLMFLIPLIDVHCAVRGQRRKRSSSRVHHFGDIDVDVNFVHNETAGENICPLTYNHMTAWERNDVITFYGFTTDFGGSRSSLSWIPCSKEKCDAGFNYRLFRAVTKASTQCCHGFKKEFDDGNGCPIGIEKKSILDTIDELHATSLHQIIQESNSNGLLKMFQSGRIPLTMFYLDDEGMAFTQNYSSHLLNSPRRFVKSHVIKGLRYSETFKDEEVVTSLTGGSIHIRLILDAGEPTLLANCVPVTDVIDHAALNGVLHSVRRPLVNPKDDLMGWLKKRKDLTTITNALQQTGVLDSSKSTSFTIFAPTNAAFERLPQHLLNDILDSPARLTAIVKQHMSDFSICDAMLDSNSSPCTLVGNRLSINRTDDKQLLINDANVLESDIITTNGVIYTIDKVFIPEQALLIPEVFPTSSLVASVVGELDLLSVLTNKHNLTFLAPSTDALQEILNGSRVSDPHWLNQVLNNHIIHARFMAHDFTRADGSPLAFFEIPEHTDDDGMVQLRRTVGLMKLQCARLVRWDVEAINGHVHEIDKVLVRPTETAWTVLLQDSRFSIFVKFAKIAGLESVLRTDNVTVFAPENLIFHHFDRDDFQKLVNNRRYLRDFMRYHIAKGRMCMSDVRRLGYPPPWYWFTTGHVETYLKGRHLSFMSGRDGTTVNNVDIAETDIVSLNGVIHVINGFLSPPRGR